RVEAATGLVEAALQRHAQPQDRDQRDGRREPTCHRVAGFGPEAERLRPTRSAHGRPDRVDVRVAVVEAEPQVRPSDGDRGCMLVAGRGVAVDRIRTRTRREEQSDETEREPHAYTPGPAAAPSPTDGP